MRRVETATRVNVGVVGVRHKCCDDTVLLAVQQVCVRAVGGSERFARHRFDLPGFRFFLLLLSAQQGEPRAAYVLYCACFGLVLGKLPTFRLPRRMSSNQPRYTINNV